MIEFQPVSHEKIGLLKEIVNSNHEFNTLSEGHSELTDEEILEMYESSKGQGAVMNFLVDGGRPVGVIDYSWRTPQTRCRGWVCS